jgi:hypothetical protein
MSFRLSRSIFRVSSESLVFQPSVLIIYGVSTESLRVLTESLHVSTESHSDSSVPKVSYPTQIHPLL